MMTNLAISMEISRKTNPLEMLDIGLENAICRIR